MEHRLLPGARHGGGEQDGEDRREDRQSPQPTAGGVEIHHAANKRADGEDEDDAVLVMAGVERLAVAVRLEDEPDEAHGIAHIVHYLVPWPFQTEGVRKIDDEQQPEGKDARHVTLPRLGVPHRGGVHVDDEEGEVEQLQVAVQTELQQFPSWHAALQLPSDGQRYRRAHGEEEEREDDVHPCQTPHRVVEDERGWRQLGVVHPCRQWPPCDA